MVCTDVILCLVLFMTALTRIAQSNSRLVQPDLLLPTVTLVPSRVIMDSTSTAIFVCINHRSEDAPFVVRLSRNISDDRLNLFTSPLNATVTQITLQSRGYIGAFHLLCHANGSESGETHADVIIKADAGILQLAHRCQVYDRQYIKCILRASTIARAIRNGFSPDIEFTEITTSQSYKKQYEFLTNESTDEYLVFKWMPTVDDQFPDGVLMNIKITLPFFGTTQYRFDMTPTFVIKPDFTVQAVTKHKVLLQLKAMSPLVTCQFSVRLRAASDTNRTWLAIESERINIIAANAVFDPKDQICVRCRQTVNDSYSDEECREIKPSVRWKATVKIVVALITAVLLIVIPINIYLCICRRKRGKRPEPRPQPEPLVLKRLIAEPTPERSVPSSETSSAQPGGAIFQGYEPSIISENESPLSPDHSSPPFASDRYSRWRP